MTTNLQLTGRELLRLMCRVRGVAPQVVDHYTLDDGDDNNENDNSKNINIYNDSHHNNHKDNENNQKK